MALVNLIRRYPFEHGEMTRKNLSKLIGASRQTVNAIDRNKHSPALEVASKFPEDSVRRSTTYSSAKPMLEAIMNPTTALKWTSHGTATTAKALLQRGDRHAPASLPERSAVVTRYSEPAVTRVLAGFCKFSVSDADSNAHFCRDANGPPCTRSDACGMVRITPAPT
jgi:putative transcriptional regulator